MSNQPLHDDLDESSNDRDDPLLVLPGASESRKQYTQSLPFDDNAASSTVRSRSTELFKRSHVASTSPLGELSTSKLTQSKHVDNFHWKNNDQHSSNTDFMKKPMTQHEFDEAYGSSRPTQGVLCSCRWLRDCSVHRVANVLLSLVPFISVLRGYNLRSDLLRDVIAGITVCVMHIPQGMAYGMLAGLPPVYGLYTSIFPVLVYCLFGTSRHISVGTFAVITLMVSVPVTSLTDSLQVYQPNTTVAPILTNTSESSITEGNDDSKLFLFGDSILTLTECRVQVAIAVTLLTGLIQLCMSVLRLGFLAVYLSQPMVNGFTTGAAFHVITSQVVYIIGYKTSQHFVGPFNLIYAYIDLLQNYAKFNSISFAISVICITILLTFKEMIQPLVSKRIKFPIPIDLALIVIGTAVSYALGLGTNYYVFTIGHIPAGFPSPQVPEIWLFSSILKDCMLIAIVSYAITISMGKIFAAKYNYNVDGNQELLALGLSNVISSFFNCHANSTSLSRSLVQEGAGCRSQVTSLISCTGLVIILLSIAPLFESVPKCVLASIILVAFKGMLMQLKDLPKLWKTSKYDFFIWIVAFTSTVIIDVDYGLIIGVVFSVFTLLYRTQMSYACVLGQVSDTNVFEDVSSYRDAQEIDGIKMFRFEGPLHFASADRFRDLLFTKTAVLSNHKANSGREDCTTSVRIAGTTQNVSVTELHAGTTTADEDYCTALNHLVIDCCSINFIDVAGVSALAMVCDECAKHDVKVFLAGAKLSIRNELERMNFFEKHSRDIMFVTIRDALTAARSKAKTKLQSID